MSKCFRGIRNSAFHNRDPGGDELWWSSKRERDRALADLRADALAAGLSASAAHAGIHAIKRCPSSEGSISKMWEQVERTAERFR